MSIRIINISKPSKNITRLICKTRKDIKPGFLLKVDEKIFLITRVEKLGASNILLDILAETIPENVTNATIIAPEETRGSIFSDASQYIISILRAMNFRVVDNPINAKILLLTKYENIMQLTSPNSHEKIIIAPSVTAGRKDFIEISNHLHKLTDGNIEFLNIPLSANQAYFPLFGLRAVKPPVLAYPLKIRKGLPLGFVEKTPICAAYGNIIVLASEGYIIPLDKIEGIACDNTLLLIKLLDTTLTFTYEKEEKGTTYIQVPLKIFEDIIDAGVLLTQKDFDQMLKFISIIGATPIERNDSLMSAKVYIPLPLQEKTVSIEVSGYHIRIKTKSKDTLDLIRRIIHSFLLTKIHKETIKNDLKSKVIKLLTLQREALKCEDMIELELSWHEILHQLTIILEIAKNEIGINIEEFQEQIETINESVSPEKPLKIEKTIIKTMLRKIIDKSINAILSLIEEI